MHLKIANLVIKSDARSYTLLEITGTSEKTGEPTYRQHGYFMTLDGVLDKIYKLGHASKEIKDLADLHAAMQKFMMDVAQAIAK